MAERTFIPRTNICAAAGPSAWPIPALRPSGPPAQRRCEPKLRSDASRDIALDSEGGGHILRTTVSYHNRGGLKIRGPANWHFQRTMRAKIQGWAN